MRIHRRSPAADDGAHPRPSGLAPDPDGQGTRQSPHSTHTHPIPHTSYNHIQCQLTLSLASTLAPASISTRHAASSPFLAAEWRGVDWNCGGGEGGDLGGGERGDGGCRGGIDEESDRGSHGLGMDDLRNCQGRGAAHANRLQDLAISRSRKVANFKCITTHAIRCNCYWRLRI